MSELKKAIAYFEDAVRESDEIIADCSPALQAELTEQKGHFVLALEIMRRAQPENEPKECPAMERVEGGIPYCSDRQTACDGCKPANEPLTLDELRGMDGDYAYFRFGDGAEGNAIIEWQSESRFILYGPVADDHSEPDIDFINMEFDDPDGHFGLHILGWRAYRRPPEMFIGVDLASGHDFTAYGRKPERSENE